MPLVGFNFATHLDAPAPMRCRQTGQLQVWQIVCCRCGYRESSYSLNLAWTAADAHAFENGFDPFHEVRLFCYTVDDGGWARWIEVTRIGDTRWGVCSEIKRVFTGSRRGRTEGA
jgi:hypothetical protein